MFIIVSIGDHGETTLVRKAFGGKSLYANAAEAKAAIEKWIALAYAPYYPEWKFSWDEEVEDPYALAEGYRAFCVVESETTEPRQFAAIIELQE